MADPVVSDDKYSIFTGPGNGTQTQWEFNFAGGYITKAHIKAYFTNDTTHVVTPIVIASGDWIGPNTIQVVPPVPTGSTITIYRDTPKDMPLVNYTNGAIINEANLDMSNEQAIFAAAEMVDQFLGVQAIADSANANAATALSTSVLAIADASVALSTSLVAGSNAATALSTSVVAGAQASTALSTALAIDGKAQTALDNSVVALSTALAIDAKATTALSNSATALSTANGVDAKADSAIATAGSAQAQAGVALSTANNANTNASSALSTASALSTSIATANATASTALSTANVALSTSAVALSTATAAASPAMNLIINGDMTIDQRGAGSGGGYTLGNAAENFTVDRFITLKNGTWSAFGARSISQVPDSSYTNGVQMLSTGAATAAEYLAINHPIEGINIAHGQLGSANAQPITIGFWVRATKAGTYPFVAVNGSSTPTRSYVTTYTINAANTNEFKQLTIPAPTSGTWSTAAGSAGLSFLWGLNVGSNRRTASINSWQSADAWAPTSGIVQLDTNGDAFFLSKVSAAFGNNLPAESRKRPTAVLQECQRYYEQLEITTTTAMPQYTQWEYKVTKCKTPTTVAIISGSAVGVTFQSTVSKLRMGTQATGSPADAVIAIGAEI
jgi:hypothetical protein